MSRLLACNDQQLISIIIIIRAILVESIKCGLCYQRLEFLGDAVLDYLVTSYLYNLDGSLSPGVISKIRAALVCNHYLAELSVDIGLHTNMLHGSPELFRKIKVYADGIKQKIAEDEGSDVAELIDGMSLEDSPSSDAVIMK